MATGKNVGRASALQVYKTEKRMEKNRLKKLERQLKLNPNNSEQILAAISNIAYRRAKPKAEVWSKTKIREVSLAKWFAKPGEVPVNNFNSFFSIAARISK